MLVDNKIHVLCDEGFFKGRSDVFTNVDIVVAQSVQVGLEIS